MTHVTQGTNYVYTIKFSWWVIYLYLPAITITARLCKLIDPTIEPNWSKVWFWVRHGTVITRNGRRVVIGHH